jgi:hypothetical protein
MRRVSDRVGGADAVSRAPGSALDPVPVVNKCPGSSDGTEPFRLSDEAPASHGAAGERRYRVRFEAEVLVKAQDIRDALRQAEARGATDVTAVSRKE